MISDAQPFSMLLQLFSDEEMAATFSERPIVSRWLSVERELANAQARHGVLTAEAA